MCQRNARCGRLQGQEDRAGVQRAVTRRVRARDAARAGRTHLGDEGKNVHECEER